MIPGQGLHENLHGAAAHAGGTSSKREAWAMHRQGSGDGWVFGTNGRNFHLKT